MKHKKANQTPWQMWQDLVNRNGADGFLMSKEVRDKYNGRLLPSHNVDLLNRFDLGSSGSGKTWFMINRKGSNDLAIYLTPDDLSWNEDEWQKRLDDIQAKMQAEPWKAKTAYQHFTEARNDEARKVLLHVIVVYLEQVRKFLNKDFAEEHPLFVAIDELGYKPHFLRALCAIHKTLERSVQQALGSDDIKCLFVAGGTGADATPLSVGSQQKTFQLFQMPTNDCVWTNLVSVGKNESKNETLKTFADMLTKNPTGQQLVTNPRIAALMYNALFGKALHDNIFWKILGDPPVARAIECALPGFFARISTQFRGLNAMNGISTKLMWRIYKSALTVVLFQGQVGVDQSTSVKLRKLISRYGVLVDEAYWADVPRKHQDSLLSTEALGTVSDPMRWYAPDPRYTMPPAQVQLFRQGYGFQMAPLTGEGFEFAMMQFLEVLLLGGGQVASLKQLLGKLGLKPGVPEDYDQPLCYAGVKVVQSGVKVEPATAEALRTGPWLTSMSKLLGTEGAENAVVLVNAPESAFADLIVLIPHRAVLLIQAKFYEQTTPFTEDDVRNELFKLGHRNEQMKELLLPLVKLETNCEMIPIFATSKDEDKNLYPDDVLHFHASAASLAPIPMPIRQRVECVSELNDVPVAPPLWVQAGVEWPPDE